MPISTKLIGQSTPRPGPSSAEAVQGPAEQSWYGIEGAGKPPASTAAEALARDPRKHPINTKLKPERGMGVSSLERLRAAACKGGKRTAGLYERAFFEGRSQRDGQSCLVRYGREYYLAIRRLRVRYE
jgi:hypothetical protein